MGPDGQPAPFGPSMYPHNNLNQSVDMSNSFHPGMNHSPSNLNYASGNPRMQNNAPYNPNMMQNYPQMGTPSGGYPMAGSASTPHYPGYNMPYQNSAQRPQVPIRYNNSYHSGMQSMSAPMHSPVQNNLQHTQPMLNQMGSMHTPMQQLPQMNQYALAQSPQTSEPSSMHHAMHQSSQQSCCLQCPSGGVLPVSETNSKTSQLMAGGQQARPSSIGSASSAGHQSPSRPLSTCSNPNAAFSNYTSNPAQQSSPIHSTEFAPTPNRTCAPEQSSSVPCSTTTVGFSGGVPTVSSSTPESPVAAKEDPIRNPFFTSPTRPTSSTTDEVTPTQAIDSGQAQLDVKPTCFPDSFASFFVDVSKSETPPSASGSASSVSVKRESTTPTIPSDYDVLREVLKPNEGYHQLNDQSQTVDALKDIHDELDVILAPPPPQPNPSRPTSLMMDGRTLIRNKSSSLTLEIPAPKTRLSMDKTQTIPPSVAYPNNVPVNLELQKVPTQNPYNSTEKRLGPLPPSRVIPAEMPDPKNPSANNLGAADGWSAIQNSPAPITQAKPPIPAMRPPPSQAFDSSSLLAEEREKTKLTDNLDSRIKKKKKGDPILDGLKPPAAKEKRKYINKSGVSSVGVPFGSSPDYLKTDSIGSPVEGRDSPSAMLTNSARGPSDNPARTPMRGFPHSNISQIPHQGTSQMPYQYTSQIPHQNPSQLSHHNASTMSYHQTSQMDHQNTSQVHQQNISQMPHWTNSSLNLQNTSQKHSQNPLEMAHQNAAAMPSQNFSQLPHPGGAPMPHRKAPMPNQNTAQMPHQNLSLINPPNKLHQKQYPTQLIPQQNPQPNISTAVSDSHKSDSYPSQSLNPNMIGPHSKMRNHPIQSQPRADSPRNTALSSVNQTASPNCPFSPRTNFHATQNLITSPSPSPKLTSPHLAPSPSPHLAPSPRLVPSPNLANSPQLAPSPRCTPSPLPTHPSMSSSHFRSSNSNEIPGRPSSAALVSSLPSSNQRPFPPPRSKSTQPTNRLSSPRPTPVDIEASTRPDSASSDFAAETTKHPTYFGQSSSFPVHQAQIGYQTHQAHLAHPPQPVRSPHLSTSPRPAHPLAPTPQGPSVAPQPSGNPGAVSPRSSQNNSFQKAFESFTGTQSSPLEELARKTPATQGGAELAPSAMQMVIAQPPSPVNNRSNAAGNTSIMGATSMSATSMSAADKLSELAANNNCASNNRLKNPSIALPPAGKKPKKKSSKKSAAAVPTPPLNGIPPAPSMAPASMFSAAAAAASMQQQFPPSHLNYQRSASPMYGGMIRPPMLNGMSPYGMNQGYSGFASNPGMPHGNSAYQTNYNLPFAPENYPRGPMPNSFYPPSFDATNCKSDYMGATSYNPAASVPPAVPSTEFSQNYQPQPNHGINNQNIGGSGIF